MRSEHVVIGLGEVGRAVKEVIGCAGYDKITENVKIVNPKFRYLHICFPWSDSFAREVSRYKLMFCPKYKPKYIIIHSTVPIGTCDALKAVHAPVRGRHPDIARSLKNFVMFVGGKGSAAVEKELVSFGIPAVKVISARDTEAMKLWDTTQYGVMILLNKEIKKFCDQHDLDFHVVYTLANQTYNRGYRLLGMPHVVRPWLDYVDGPIGGHCVRQNAKLLNSESAQRLRD